MHEFTLAQGLHSQLLELAYEHQVAKVLKAEVAVGDNAGIVIESFVLMIIGGTGGLRPQ
jgi:Zn finger protein HypA/HybF involved in hydrogenase expression